MAKIESAKMAKIESAKMAVSLDNDSKRTIRNLTKAIDRLSRTLRPYEVKDGTRRLIEPADVLGKYEAGEISDAELEEMKQQRPEMFETEPALRNRTTGVDQMMYPATGTGDFDVNNYKRPTN